MITDEYIKSCLDELFTEAVWEICPVKYGDLSRDEQLLYEHAFRGGMKPQTDASRYII